jgi:hypothetical protein
MRGNVKRKYFSLELKCAEVWSRHSAPSHALCQCVMTICLGICSDPPKRIMLISPLEQQHRGRPSGGGRRLLVSALSFPSFDSRPRLQSLFYIARNVAEVCVQCKRSMRPITTDFETHGRGWDGFVDILTAHLNSRLKPLVPTFLDITRPDES